MRFTLSLVTMLLLGSPLHAAELDLQSQIDPLAKPLIDNGVAVGFTVGIYKDGKTQILSYGETTKGSGQAPDGNTLYEIGSISKVFTATLLASAQQRGKLKTSDPVQKFLPSSVKMPRFEETTITLEHLATHRSGITRMPANFQPADPANPYADYSEARLFEFLAKHKLRRAPGKYEYSNVGAGLLGQLLARHSGQSYEKLLRQQICDPLQMNDTTVVLTAEQKKRFTTPYNADLRPNKAWDFTSLAGAGGIRSTTNDMLKFIQANLKEDDSTLTKALQQTHGKRADIHNGLAIGLGWHIARDHITRWHNGMTGGYHAWLAVVPGQNMGVVVLSNTATSKITQFGEQVTRIGLGAIGKPVEHRKEIAVGKDILQAYRGSYPLAPTFVLTVTLEKGQLMVQATGQPKLPIYAETDTKFFYKIVDAEITFHKDEKGEVTHLVLHQNGRKMKGNKTKSEANNK